MIKILQDLVERLTAVQVTPDTLSDDDLAQTGVFLWQLGDIVSGFLDGIKETLRKRALALRGGHPGAVSFAVPAGTCVVSLQGSEIKVRKDMMPALRASLGDSLFTSLFDVDTVYRPRPTFSDTTSACTPDQQKEIFNAVDVQMRTPRVSFVPGK